MKFIEEVEAYFWNNDSKEEIVLGTRTTTILDEAIYILQLQDNEVQDYINENPDLIHIFSRQEIQPELPIEEEVQLEVETEDELEIETINPIIDDEGSTTYEAGSTYSLLFTK